VELVSLILCFTTIFLKLVDKVTQPIHFHSLHAFPCEVHHEPGDLCGVVLSDDLSISELEREVRYAILDIGYLVASLSLFYFFVCLFYAL
jgi:hypothetical protein